MRFLRRTTNLMILGLPKLRATACPELRDISLQYVGDLPPLLIFTNCRFRTILLLSYRPSCLIFSRSACLWRHLGPTTLHAYDVIQTKMLCIDVSAVTRGTTTVGRASSTIIWLHPFTPFRSVGLTNVIDFTGLTLSRSGTAFSSRRQLSNSSA
jgi:hypothetical protein